MFSKRISLFTLLLCFCFSFSYSQDEGDPDPNDAGDIFNPKIKTNGGAPLPGGEIPCVFEICIDITTIEPMDFALVNFGVIQNGNLSINNNNSLEYLEVDDEFIYTFCFIGSISDGCNVTIGLFNLSDNSPLNNCGDRDLEFLSDIYSGICEMNMTIDMCDECPSANDPTSDPDPIPGTEEDIGTRSNKSLSPEYKIRQNLNGEILVYDLNSLPEESITIFINDNVGKVLYKKNCEMDHNETITLTPNLNSGIYYISIINGEGMTSMPLYIY